MEEEEEVDVTEIGAAVSNLIALLRVAHNENRHLHYYATREPNNSRGRSIMPVTPFVFELFIYNSIYQVDWPASLKAGCVESHPRDAMTETRQQDELERFLKPHIREKPGLLFGAFKPIREASLEGAWTKVVPDARISAAEGEHFFERMRRLRNMLRETERPEALRVNNQLFDLIKNCRRYVYLVRNNIFHGSKTLGETYEQNQRDRIELYLSLVRCLNQLFFDVCGEISHEVNA
jgi:hypothetical protein